MTNTIKCVILDDELLAISYLKLLCEQIEGVEVVKAFNRPDIFLQEINNIDCDLCILDIEMPNINGLQVAAQIPDKQIIFTTAYKDYAADAFDLNVVDYVRKPLKKERLEQAFEKVKVVQKPIKKSFFEWNTGIGKTQIDIKSLLYIHTSDIDSRDKTALLDDYSEITLKNINFKTLLSLLPEQEFVQINKKEVLAISVVKAFSDNEIVTNIHKDGEPILKLALTEAFRENFNKTLS
ncbi:response regulator [Soonwooa sp.]|uniref:LytR/AlgR family response regulator transcription factor n=1 Tax=Soonwooa sp. TaxID=1938592 RepID=UPI0026094E54|nr:response regulator [Soonwooa sp.]